MKFNICVSIPIKNTSFKEVEPIIADALKSNPKLIELRFDYISNIKTLSMDFLRDILKSIKPYAGVIFTLRDPSEGGQLKINQKERFKILKIFIETKPDYIDIEMNTDQDIISEIINLTSQNEVKIIFSYHNFEKTISFDDTIKLIQNFNNKLIQDLSLGSDVLEEIIYKIIYTAQKFEDNLIPLKLCKELSNSNQKIISFCMGPLGIFSRITCILAGSYFTYASLEEKTASGQINVRKMKEMYNLILNNH